MKKEPNVRVIVHDKSSLAPEGKSMAFSLGSEEGFHWLDGYEDITAEELLCGVSSATKTASAEELIRDMLSSGEPVAAIEIFRMAEAKGISKRTVNEAKKNIDGIVSTKIGNGAWFIMVTSYRQQVGKAQFQVVCHFGGKTAIEEKLGDLMVDELSEKVSEDTPES